MDRAGPPRLLEAADGTPLAWRAEGEGATLVFTNGLANSPYQWRAVGERLRGHARLVSWDFRGHGDSGPARDPRGLTIEGVVDDLQRVVDAAVGPDEPVVLLGYSLGVQVNLAAWRRFGHRVRGFVHVLGTYGRPFDSLYSSRVLGRATHGLLKAASGPALSLSFRFGRRAKPVAFGGARLLGATGARVGYRDFAGFLEQLGGVDGASFRALALAAQAHSAEDVLGEVDVPSLVISGGRDLFAPPSVGRRIADEASDSEHLHLPRAGHTGLLGHTAEITDEVERFLRGRGLLG